jgi:hypothetical protein
VPTARPYDLRHSFASLLLHEGKVSVVDLASQLGHSPTMTLNTYGHVMRELREAPRFSATEQIQLARERFRGSAPKWTPQRENAISGDPEDRVATPEPTAGLEPATPSLRGFAPPTPVIGFKPPLCSRYAARKSPAIPHLIPHRGETNGPSACLSSARLSPQECPATH